MSRNIMSTGWCIDMSSIGIAWTLESESDRIFDMGNIMLMTSVLNEIDPPNDLAALSLSFFCQLSCIEFRSTIYMLRKLNCSGQCSSRCWFPKRERGCEVRNFNQPFI